MLILFKQKIGTHRSIFCKPCKKVFKGDSWKPFLQTLKSYLHESVQKNINVSSKYVLELYFVSISGLSCSTLSKKSKKSYCRLLCSIGKVDQLPFQSGDVQE